MALNEMPKTSVDLETEIAKLTILRHIVASVVSNHTGELWEDYPEIGEHDWIDISERVLKAYAFPTDREFKIAYAHLASRADH